MNSTVPETELETPCTSSNGSNGQSKPVANGHRARLTQPGLGDHPLWQDFLDIMKANREADIAEANRLADLELKE